jgi:GPH family glycoside/pentoside/hexuronide:cation symporter/probable glucitol transport protein GutA
MAVKTKEKKAQAPQKDVGRRYVGSRETFAYVMYDVAQSVPKIDMGEFGLRVLPIDLRISALLGPFATAWDIINDLFCAAWVDKTRTRFGKFKPYLVLYPLYGIPMRLLFFLLPFFFWDKSNDFLPKIAANFALGLFNGLTSTISDICRTGMLANITPNPEERLLLITKANFFSMFGEDLPSQVFGVLRDIISRSTSKSLMQRNLNMRTLYLTFGMGTILIAGALSLYIAVVARERVFGSESAREKPPSVKEQILALRRNRPLLMIMLAEILGSINVKSQSGHYHKAVLNFANFGLVAGIPGSIPSYLSYAWVPRMRRRFSTKTLWIMNDYINPPMLVLIYFFGRIKTRNPEKIARGITHNFLDLIPMLIVYGIQTTIDMCFYGQKKVIPEELRNECIDYGEWKSGFRSEGMTGVVRGIPTKVTKMFGDSMNNLILSAIGFKIGDTYIDQDAKTKSSVFLLSTLVPALFSLVTLPPKLLFNITQKDREVMYAELAERRALAAAAAMERAETQAGAG